MVTIWTVFLIFFPSVAGSILSKIDRSVNPCEDFYSFSCGGWLKENPIPEDSSSYGIYPWLRQHVDIRLKGVFYTLLPSLHADSMLWFIEDSNLNLSIHIHQDIACLYFSCNTFFLPFYKVNQGYVINEITLHVHVLTRFIWAQFIIRT